MNADRATRARHRRLAPFALVLLIPCAVAITGYVSWFDYLAGQPSSPVAVERGDSAEIGGAKVRLVNSWVVRPGDEHAEGMGLADDEAAVLARLELVPSTGVIDYSCDIRLVDADASRWWKSELFVEDGPWSGEFDAFSCSSEGETIEIVQEFRLPQDAVTGVRVEVRVSEQLPQVLRLAL